MKSGLALSFMCVVLVSTGERPATAAPRLYSASLQIEMFGNDTTTGSAFPFSVETHRALVLGQNCNDAYGSTTGTCGLTTLRDGAPLTGSGTASVMATTYVDFTLPASDIAVFAQGSRPWNPPTLYSYTYANLKNGPGSFFAGGGPGTVSRTLYIGPSPMGRARVTPGPQQFGGVMRLLGAQTGQTGIYRNGGLSIGAVNRRFDAVGYYSSSTLLYTVDLYHTNLFQSTNVKIYGHPFRWTTGTVSVTGNGGSFDTAFERKGYDNRTPGGDGTIQLVTPYLVEWHQPAISQTFATIGVLKIQFVPEPASWLGLAAGLGGLTVLHRTRRRRSRRPEAD